MRAEYPHHVWAIGFQFDQTMNGSTLKFLNVIDEFSRVCLAIRVGRRCRAVEVIDTIEELLKLCPAPTYLRKENGPEFIAHALQEWCTGNGPATAYIPPGSPPGSPPAMESGLITPPALMGTGAAKGVTSIGSINGSDFTLKLLLNGRCNCAR